MTNTESVENENKSKCCWVRCILAVIAFAVIASLSGWLVWGNLYVDALNEFKQVWRQMDAEEWKLMPLANLLHAIFFVFVFCKLGCCVTSKCGTNFGCGVTFGFYIWLFVGVLAGFWAYIIHPISIEVAIAYLVDGAIINIIGGGVVGVIKGKVSKCPEKAECAS